VTRVFEFDKREKLFLLILSIIILTGVTYLTYTKINCTKLNLEAYKKENTQIEEVFAPHPELVVICVNLTFFTWIHPFLN
jgi:cell division protein FtsL